jgi:hypothetical protein
VKVLRIICSVPDSSLNKIMQPDSLVLFALEVEREAERCLRWLVLVFKEVAALHAIHIKQPTHEICPRVIHS